MKRVIFFAAAIVICISLCFALASCGEADEETPPENKQRSSQADDADYEDDTDYEGEDYESDNENADNNDDGGNDDGGNAKQIVAGIGGIAGNSYTGLSGSESTAYTICLNVSSDGNNGTFVYGVPGASDFVLGQLTYNGDVMTIHPLDGSGLINMELKDRGRGDGSLSYRSINKDGATLHEGWLDLVSKDEFDEAVDMLS